MSTMALAPSEITRNALLQRIESARPRVVFVNAPAGYGKSTLARQLGTIAGSAATCDFFGVADATDAAQRLSLAIAGRDPDRLAAVAQRHLISRDDADWISLALELWGLPSLHGAVIFENAEHAARVAPAVELLVRLFARAQPDRQTILCTRQALPISPTRFFAPHEILTVGPDELRFTPAEIAAAFGETELTPAQASSVARLTRGWPIAVFMMARLAREMGVEQALRFGGGVAFEHLYDYLAEQIIEAMPADRFESLLAVSALGTASEAEVRAAAGERCEALGEIARSSPFLYAIDGRRFETHPLVRSMILERMPSRCADLRLCAAEGLEAQDPLRAAQLYVEAGEKERAASLLEHSQEFLMGDSSPLFAEIVGSLDNAILVAHPGVWQAATLTRILSIPHEQWIAEGLAVREKLSPATPPAVRIGVMSSLANALTNLGRHAEAVQIFDEIDRAFPDLPQARAVSCGFRAMIDVRSGRFTRGMAQWEQAVPLFSASNATLALGIVQIEALALRYRGERERERQRLETAIVLAQQGNSPLALALALQEATFASWFAGEDTLWQQCRAALDQLANSASRMATEVFRGCAAGDVNALRAGRGVEHPKIAFYGSLMLSTLVPGEARRECATRALAAAQLAAEPMSEAIACIACAEYFPDRRAHFIAQARQSAARTESLVLALAIDAYARNSPGLGILAPLLERMRGSQAQRPAAARGGYTISLLQGKLLWGEAEIQLAPREFALLLFLAMRSHPCRTEEIAEALWPASRPNCSTNVRVYVSRLRQRCGNAEIIASERGMYRLAQNVDVDLLHIERTIARARSAPASDFSGIDAELAAILERLMSAPRRALDDFEWYAPVRVRIEDMAREAATILARRALARNEPNAALAYAQKVVERDPCDEPAREAVVRAYLAAGDRASALREFRTYRKVLAAELGAEPSAALQDLVVAADAELSAPAKIG